jgi:hypothetical protein
LKAKLVVILLSCLFVNVAFADCKSTPGGCGAQDSAGAAHLNAGYVNKTETDIVVLPTRGELEAARKSGTTNKINNKKNGNGSLVNASQKKVIQ